MISITNGGWRSEVSRYIDLAVEGGSLILVGDPQRNYFPRTKFHKADEYPVPVTRELEDALIKNTAVWRLGAT